MKNSNFNITELNNGYKTEGRGYWRDPETIIKKTLLDSIEYENKYDKEKLGTERTFCLAARCFVTRKMFFIISAKKQIFKGIEDMVFRIALTVQAIM